MNNLYKDIPLNLEGEVFETIVENDKFRLERIISNNYSMPEGEWFDQDGWEWVVVLRGGAILRFEEEPVQVRLEEGDYLLIEPHRKHRVEKTSENTIWLAIHYK